MAPPLTLETPNRIVLDLFQSKFKAYQEFKEYEHQDVDDGGDKKRITKERVDVTIADFNQCLWHISNGDGANWHMFTVSLSVRAWGQVDSNGSRPYLQKIYGPWIKFDNDAEPNYNITLTFSIEKIAANQHDATARKVSLLQRHTLAGPFYKVFEDIEKHTEGPMVEVGYRPFESYWLKPQGDRCICVFSIVFDDPDDVVIGRVFLQEFAKLMSGAPAIDTRFTPPLELDGIKNLPQEAAYASILLESRHYAPKARDRIVDLLLQFRNYLHYHIKCSKAYLHIRMRNRVDLLLQVLNRAKQEKLNDKQKKTQSGRTFVRQ